MGNIAGAYNAGTGVMTLTSAGGTATLAQWQVALRAVQYSNSSDNPSTSARTVSFIVNDGTANSNTVASTVNVAAVNDASTLATGSTLNYTENGAATAINTALTVADLDNATLPSATVSITGGFASAEDVLSFTNVPATMGNIAGAYNAGTGVMTLTSAGGTATLAQWQVALRAVQYSNSSDNPSTSARTVSFTVNDSAANSNTVTSTVNVAAVNDVPVLTTGSTLNFSENGAATAINTALTVADPDNATLSSGTVSITGGFASAEDVLSFTNVPATMGNIAGSYNAGTGVMTLTSAGGTATLAQWQAAFRAVQYSNSSDNPSTAARTVSFAVNDGTLGSNTVASTVNVAAVNDASTLATGSTLNYTENGAATAINTALTVADLDNATLPSATVSLTGGFGSGEDVLSFTSVPATMGNIAGVYNAGTGVMTLTSAGNTATLAQWQTALRAVQYSNSSDNPSTASRTVSFTVNDSAANSNTVASTVNVAAVNDAPVLATGSTLNYTENGAATAINTALTVADADNATLSSATVSITGGFASSEDVLSFTNVPATMGNIAGSYNAGTGVMTLTSAGSTATLAQWQVAFRAVQYSNSSDNPSTSARTVSFTVNDSAANSNTVASTVNVAAVDDAPVLATGSTLNYTENGVATAINTTLTVADVDNAALSSGTVSITANFASGQDVLGFTNVPATMGNIAGAYNAGTGVMTLTSAGSTATLAQWQAAFRAVQYSNSSDNPSTAARTVSFAVNDGTLGSNTGASTVNVAAVDDASTPATGSTLNYTENGAASAINTTVTVTDLDNATLTSGTVSLTAGFASGEDVLSFTSVPATMGNIAGVYNAGTGVMTLISAGNTATLAQWQVALRAVQYSNSSDNPSTSARTVSFTVNDSAANSNTLTSTVNVAAVNDAPVLATGSTLNYTENGAATAINTALTLADLDNTTLPSATVSITGGFASAEDVLSFTNVPATMGNIAGS